MKVPMRFIFMTHDGRKGIAILLLEPIHRQTFPVFNVAALRGIRSDFFDRERVARDNCEKGMLIDANFSRLATFGDCPGRVRCRIVPSLNCIDIHAMNDDGRRGMCHMNRCPRIASSFGKNESCRAPGGIALAAVGFEMDKLERHATRIATGEARCKGSKGLVTD